MSINQISIFVIIFFFTLFLIFSLFILDERKIKTKLIMSEIAIILTIITFILVIWITAKNYSISSQLENISIIPVFIIIMINLFFFILGVVGYYMYSKKEKMIKSEKWKRF